MDLPDDVYDRIEALSEEGNELLDVHDDWEGALLVWRQGLELLPEPKSRWEAALWLNASIGEACRRGGRLEDTRSALLDALNAPDGHMNPLVNLRLGQTLVDLGQPDQGVEYLLRAYMLEGEAVFDVDGAEYLTLLRARQLIG